MSWMADREHAPRRIEISFTQLFAGSAAAACGAWLASKIGVAGTVIGAAIVSSIVTVLSAVYAQGARRARERLVLRREVMRARPQLPASYAADAPAVEAEPESDDDELSSTKTLFLPAVELEDAHGYHWGRIALAALAVFVVGMLVVTVIELVDGHTFACSTAGIDCNQGTTLLPAVHHPKATPTKSTSAPTPSSSATPTPSVKPSATPSATPTLSSTASSSPSLSTTPTTSATTSPTLHGG